MHLEANETILEGLARLAIYHQSYNKNQVRK